MKKFAKKGQGIVEYAGALVVAAVLVAAVLGATQTGMASTFTSLIQGIETYFSGQIPS